MYSNNVFLSEEEGPQNVTVSSITVENLEPNMNVITDNNGKLISAPLTSSQAGIQLGNFQNIALQAYSFLGTESLFYKWVSPTTMTPSEITIWVDNDPTQCAVAIYSDDSNALVCDGSSLIPSVFEQTITLTTTAELTSGKSYWIAISADLGFKVGVNTDSQSNSNLGYQSGSNRSTGFPPTQDTTAGATSKRPIFIIT